MARALFPITGAKRAAEVEHDSIRDYLIAIAQVPLLSKDEEVELARRARAGDIEARNRLMEANLRLVVSIAKRYVVQDVGLLDIWELHRGYESARCG